MSIAAKAAALAALLVAGVLLAAAVAGGGRAADTTTTTEPTTDVTTETTTVATTETVSTTVQQTTTRRVVVPPPTTTSTGSNDSSIPTWVWVVIGVLAAGLLALLIVLLARRGPHELPTAERARLLDAAVNSWVVQGWAIQSRTPDSAVLSRGSEQMLVTIDPFGRVTSRPVAN